MSTRTPSPGNARRGSPVFFAAALAASLGILLLVFGAFTVLLNAGEGSVTPVVDSYFARFNASDFAGIYANAAEPLMQTTSQEKFVEAQALIREKLGVVEHKTIRGISLVRERGPVSTVITYDTQFANGPATVALTIHGNGEEGKLVSAEFRSELLPRPERGRRWRG